jgi:hypothetical protein
LGVTFTLLVMWLAHTTKIQVVKKSNMVDYVYMYEHHIGVPFQTKSQLLYNSLIFKGDILYPCSSCSVVVY